MGRRRTTALHVRRAMSGEALEPRTPAAPGITPGRSPPCASQQGNSPGEFSTSRGCLAPRRPPSAHARPDVLGEGGHLRLEVAAVGGQELEDEVLDPALGQLGDLVHDRRCLARDDASGVGRWGRRLARPQDADVVAERQRGRRRAATRLAEADEL